MFCLIQQEAELRGREDTRCKGAVVAAREHEFRRNRERLDEVRAWLGSVMSRINGIRAELDNVENDLEINSVRSRATTSGASGAGGLPPSASGSRVPMLSLPGK